MNDEMTLAERRGLVVRARQDGASPNHCRMAGDVKQWIDFAFTGFYDGESPKAVKRGDAARFCNQQR